MAANILSIDLQTDLLTATLLADDINKDIIDSAVIATAGKSSAEIIAELTAALDCSNCRCFLALSGSFFSFRNLHLPFSDHKSIDKILPFELEESSPIPIHSMLFDSLVNSGGETEAGAEVLCAMIERETLAEYHQGLKDVELAPEIITISGLATIAAIHANGHPPEDFLFLDLRLNSATLFLISAGRLQLVRPLTFNLLSSTAEGEIGLKIDSESGQLLLQAGEQTKEAVHSLARTVQQTLAPLPLPTPFSQLPIYVDTSANAMEDIFPLLEAADGFNRPCLICGRGGLLPPPVALPEKTKKHISQLTGCLSLGSQGEKIKGEIFNFCREEFSFRRKLSSYQKLGKLIGLPLLALLLIGLGVVWYQNRSLGQQRAALVSEINELFRETLPEVSRIVDPVQQLQVAVDNTRLSSADDGGNPILSHSARHILREISTRIPHSLDIRLTRLIYESKGLRIMGLADSFNTVDSVKKKLEQSPDFNTVTISSTKQAPRDNKIRFELKIDVGESRP
ncbi:MAG: PilN domain-containing protein [Thermodesulfobacteriota bacterium]